MRWTTPFLSRLLRRPPSYHTTTTMDGSPTRTLRPSTRLGCSPHRFDIALPRLDTTQIQYCPTPISSRHCVFCRCNHDDPDLKPRQSGEARMSLLRVRVYEFLLQVDRGSRVHSNDDRCSFNGSSSRIVARCPRAILRSLFWLDYALQTKQF